MHLYLYFLSWYSSWSRARDYQYRQAPTKILIWYHWLGSTIVSISHRFWFIWMKPCSHVDSYFQSSSQIQICCAYVRACVCACVRTMANHLGIYSLNRRGEWSWSLWCQKSWSIFTRDVWVYIGPDMRWLRCCDTPFSTGLNSTFVYQYFLLRLALATLRPLM